MRRLLVSGMAHAVIAASLMSPIPDIAHHEIERANTPVSPKPKIKKSKRMRRKKWWKEGKPNSGRDSKQCFLKGVRP